MGYYGWTNWDWDEKRDFKVSPVWIADIKDCWPINTPLVQTRYVETVEHSPLEYAAAYLSLPTTKGLAFRVKGAIQYLTGIIVSDEAEIKQREAKFRERIAPWIEDYGREWGKLKNEIWSTFENLRKVKLEELSTPELRNHFDDWLYASEVAWRHHFVGMYTSYYLYVTFDDMCHELFGIGETHPKFKALMAGFENRTFETDRKLWELGSLAKELGLKILFDSVKDDELLLKRLKEDVKGRQWLEKFSKFLDEDGWRCPGHVGTFDTPSWIERPSQVIPDIRRAIAKGGTHKPEEERERLARAREEIEKELLSRVPRDKKALFEGLMRCAQWAGRFSEDHSFYCEHLINALGRRVTKEIGKRFAQKGFINDSEDVYFLLPEEIRIRLFVHPLAEAAQELVNIRKKEFEEYARAGLPELLLGNPAKLPEQIAKEPLLRIVSPAPKVRPELKAALYGTGSAPGVVEGIARLVLSPQEFPLVKPGEILVTPVTDPSWTSIFSVVAGVVTDVGGGLSHAVIVGREFGIPAVAGTMEGTQKIKTGQRIRVDGDNCAVYILG